MADFNKERMTPPKKEFPEIMTAVQAADYLQIKEKTIRNWTSQGRIPSASIGGAVRYKKSDIDKLLVKKKKSR